MENQNILKFESFDQAKKHLDDGNYIRYSSPLDVKKVFIIRKHDTRSGVYVLSNNKTKGAKALTNHEFTAILTNVVEDGDYFKEGGFTSSDIVYGDYVEVKRTSTEDSTNSVGPKYKKGQKGYVFKITETDGKFTYDIHGGNLGMGAALGIPKDDLKLLGKEKKDKVNKILDEKEKKKYFKDVGTRVAGSKKEQRAYTLITGSDLSNLELDDITAHQLVVKDKVYPEINVAEQRAAGVTSGAAFLKVELRKACGAKPPNDKAKRAGFVHFIGELTKKLEPLKTVKEIEDYLDSWRKIDLRTILNLFFDLPNVSEEKRAEVEAAFTEKFSSRGAYYVFKQAIEEVFGKRFLNFLFFSSVPARQVLQTARSYAPISKEEAAQLLEKREKQINNDIRINNEKIADYSRMNDEELRDAFKNWNASINRFKKDLEGFRKNSISYFERKRDAAAELLKKVPDSIKVKDEDWSWFETKKEKKTVEKSGEIPINVGIPLSYIKRTGGLVIKEEYISQAANKNPDENPITRDLGFKSAQFGAALKGSEAKEHIRHFLGAICDLSEILDIDIKQLNKLGGLSIAFATRGSGRASATYYPGRTIINLTNNRGDGAVAHEWFHYLDNILTMIGKDSSSLQYGSEIKKMESRYSREYKIESYINNEAISKAMFDIMEFIYRGKPGITPQVYRHFKAMEIGKPAFLNNKDLTLKRIPSFYDQVTKEFVPVEIKGSIDETLADLKAKTRAVAELEYDNPGLQYQIIGYVIGAFGLDGYDVPFDPPKKWSAYYYYSSLMNSNYWIRPQELFARAGECYIFDKLQVKGRMNNYLVSGDYFEHKVNLKYGGYSYVYPFGKEREYLFDLFEILFNEIKTQYNMSAFNPFTENRQDEYIVLQGDGKGDGIEVETMESGGLASEDNDTYEDGGQVEKIFGDNDYVTIWSRYSGGEGRFHFGPWTKEESYPLLLAQRLLGRKIMTAEGVHVGNREYSWFPEDVDPNEERRKRLDQIYYDGMLETMRDLKKDFFTEAEFEYWWDKTNLEDDSKEFVREKLKENQLIK